MENNSNIKIGTIVNDVASVNIDAKLIANSDAQRDANQSVGNLDSDGGVIELQNGCACCSLSDELFTSIEKITQNGERDLDAIVVELSGVADPMAVRENWAQAAAQEHPATRLAALARTVTLVDACTFGTDWMTWESAGQRDAWTEPDDGCAAARKVPELLAEQVEAADLLLINKIDLAGETQVGVASSVARGLNDKASLMEVEFGRVDARELLGKMLDGDEDEAGKGAEKEEKACCSNSKCTDASHDHDHSSHSHDHKTTSKTSADQLGITSFVYQTNTPFNSQRLMTLLNRWPVPLKDSLDFMAGTEAQEFKGDGESADEFMGVLRSKGFCWMAPAKWSSNAANNDAWRHDTAMYWSHAGKHFGITSAGKWWGTLSKEEMKPYFANNMEEYARIMEEDWQTEEWGDRRQELVFIGAKLSEDDIRASLDNCLCTEEEMVGYRAQVKKNTANA